MAHIDDFLKEMRRVVAGNRKIDPHLYDPDWYRWQIPDPHPFPEPRTPWFAIAGIVCLAAAALTLCLCLTVAVVHGDDEPWLLGTGITFTVAALILWIIHWIRALFHQEPPS